MSKLETNTIDTVSGTSTLQVGSTNTSTITLGVSGDTINVPSGVTINNNGTQTGFGGSNTPYMYARNSGDQSISATTWTKVVLNTESVDSNSAFASNTFTVPSGEAGKYLITAFVRYEALNGASEYGYLSITNSDRSTTYAAVASSGSTGYGFHPQACSAIVNLSAGNTISLHVYATEAASLSQENNGLTICKMID